MSLLRSLARSPGERANVQIEYDQVSQVSRVRENGVWVESWNAQSLRGTKKEDHETGEDAKGQ